MASRSYLQALILAAGRSRRFNTEQTKLSFLICGQEMILYPTKLMQQLEIPTTLIVGHQKDIIKNIIDRHKIQVDYVEQKEQKGTGHAVLCSKEYWHADNVLIMYGDMPLVTKEIIQELIETHERTNATITFITAHNSDPNLEGYGRIIRNRDKITIIEKHEFKHNDPAQQCCINAGIYMIKRAFLEENLKRIVPSAKTGEIYLTELIRAANAQGLKVETVHQPFDLIRGINTLKELWAAEHIKRSELIAFWMSRGVQFSTAHNVHIDIDVTIGSGTFIGAGVLLLGATNIGSNCFIDAFAIITNTKIHDNVTVLPHSVIYDSTICNSSKVGPFAHIRKNSSIGKNSIVGNFVEVSASTIGENSKAKHLSYLGNASIGSQVNIGAGAITCNYDGFKKHQTIIKDGASIGAINALVAPVTIGQDAITGAGSTITQDVPDCALAIARDKQVNKEGYALKIKNKRKSDTIVKPAKEIFEQEL